MAGVPLYDRPLQERIQQQMRDRALYDMHALEQNPLTHFYHVLWEGTKDWSLTMHHLSMANRPADLGQFRLRQIPDTIVWENNIPKGWYRYEEEDEETVEWKSQRGTGRRRREKLKVGNIKKDKVDTKKIDAVFTANAEDDDSIVAMYMARHAEHTSDVTRVDYFTRPALRDFLFSKNKGKGTCILQQWVVPQNRRHNDVIQAVWTPGIKTLIDRRQNVHDLEDPRVPPHERAMTFDGPPHLSVSINCSPRISTELRRICQSIAEHFAGNTVQGPKQAPRHRLTRLVLTCKIDTAGRLVILSMSSARVENVGRPRTLYVALELAPRYQQLSLVGEGSDDDDEKPADAVRQRGPGAPGSMSSFRSKRQQQRVERRDSDSLAGDDDDDVVAWFEGRAQQRRWGSPTKSSPMHSFSRSPAARPARGKRPSTAGRESLAGSPTGQWSKRGSVAWEREITPRAGGEGDNWQQPRAGDVFSAHRLPRYRGTGCGAAAAATLQSLPESPRPGTPVTTGGARGPARRAQSTDLTASGVSPQHRHSLSPLQTQAPVSPTNLWAGKPALWGQKGGGFILRSAPHGRPRRRGGSAQRGSHNQTKRSTMDMSMCSSVGGRRWGRGTVAERRVVAQLTEGERVRRGGADVQQSAMRRLMRHAMELGEVSAWGPEEQQRLRTEYLRCIPPSSLRSEERVEYIYLSLGDRLRAKAAAEQEQKQPVRRVSTTAEEKEARAEERRERAKGRWVLVRRAVQSGFMLTKIACGVLIQELQDFVYRLESHLLLVSQSTVRGGNAPPFAFALPPCPPLAEPAVERLLGLVGAEHLGPSSPPPTPPPESEAPEPLEPPVASAVPPSPSARSDVRHVTVPPLSVHGSSMPPSPAVSVRESRSEAPRKPRRFKVPEGWQGWTVTKWDVPVHKLSIELSKLRREVGRALRVREAAALRSDHSSAQACIRALDSLAPPLKPSAASARSQVSDQSAPVTPTPIAQLQAAPLVVERLDAKASCASSVATGQVDSPTRKEASSSAQGSKAGADEPEAAGSERKASASSDDYDDGGYDDGQYDDEVFDD